MNFLRHATVEWTISDPKPKVVHWFENGHHQPGQQHESYRRRTEMANPLQTGDLSLTLNDPCCDDSGIYICTVRRGQDILAQKVIEVQVQVCQLKVKEGAQSITLSYQTTDELPEDATVEWTISDPEPKVVHRFENGHHQPGQQHEYYFERTEMANPLQTGDLSLTLSDPCCDDSGIYICTVHRGRHILAQKVVEVRVQRQYCTKIRATDWIEMKRSTVKKPQARRKDPDSVTVYSADSGVTF
ncbi:uncharacterized protein LOC108902375 isoform X2 [Lates calcarifer]|uniref:Uncharacterized protein LOC108902375 isoform X2 n=1 Tax=Lates calcarifer TaxID=8187 RepID=A0AAJ7QM93_LATCA|nr:uncharacterized protein LOC108902375 isoform X2 [Lates calcarifer]